MDDGAMVQLLTERIAAETPAPGTNPLADRMSSDAQLLRRFDQVRAPSASQGGRLLTLYVPPTHPTGTSGALRSSRSALGVR